MASELGRDDDTPRRDFEREIYKRSDREDSAPTNAAPQEVRLDQSAGAQLANGDSSSVMGHDVPAVAAPSSDLRGRLKDLAKQRWAILYEHDAILLEAAAALAGYKAENEVLFNDLQQSERRVEELRVLLRRWHSSATQNDAPDLTDLISDTKRELGL